MTYRDNFDDDFSELDDLDDRLRELERAQTAWERLSYLQTLKMPCPACGGAGSLYGGSLGNTCPECLGTRMVEHPAAQEIEVPADFFAVRRLLNAAAKARDQRLGLRAPGEDRAMMPDLSSLPSLQEIRDFTEQGRQLALQAPQTPVVQGQLREPPRPRLDAPDDRQLDALEDGEEGSFAAESSIGGEGLDDEYLDEIERKA